MILKRMKRRHLRADAFAVVEKLRALRPEIVFGADIIAGFPTETDEMFENSLEFIETANLTYIHAFPYSPRPGTPAARMPQVEKAVAKARANRLRALGNQQIEKLAQSRLGMVETVLVEKDGMGRQEQFLPVAVPGHGAGELIAVRITGTNADGLVGEPMRSAA
jgi:threonylcarbamoyladenosine tRNA methylthiotransferase MtaB